MAEAHPVGFQWVMEAKKRGAKIIHVDPRFSRTSAVADLHVPIRAGRGHRVRRRPDQLRAAERASTSTTTWSATPTRPTIITEDFQDTEDLDGLFSGFDPEHRTYDPETWRYQGGEVAPASGARGLEPDHRREVQAASRGEAHGSGGAAAHPDAGHRPHAAAPAVRVPDPQAALRPVHAGDGGGGRPACPRSSSSRWPG